MKSGSKSKSVKQVSPVQVSSFSPGLFKTCTSPIRTIRAGLRSVEAGQETSHDQLNSKPTSPSQRKQESRLDVKTTSQDQDVGPVRFQVNRDLSSTEQNSVVKSESSAEENQEVKVKIRTHIHQILNDSGRV